MFMDGLLRHKGFVLGLLVSSALFVPPVSARAHDPFPVLLVDKATNSILIGSYQSDHIEVAKKYHVTLGKVKGDKEAESDLKTPEGVYFLTAKLTPPSLKKKFGIMAYMMNYPNPIDHLRGKTGYDIMLHATDDPSRLNKDYDSLGCVVVDNSQLEEISKTVRLGLTPIIIYPELKQEYLSASAKPDVREAFDKWLKAWNGKDLDNYIGAYAKSFHYNGMNVKQYRDYKAQLNQRYAQITVKADHLRFYWHPKYDVVSFTQVYESRLKNGSKGFKSSGTKNVYFVHEDGTLKIADESYSSIRED
jgi:murein L,D-transpeptidase YafK